MKQLLILALVLFTGFSFAQNKQVILISSKYDFQNQPNSYNINNILKSILISNNFEVYFDDEILPVSIAQNRCLALTGVLVDKSNVFLTKLKFQIKDCQNNLLFETAEVKSKEKDIQMGYIEAIKLLSPELKKYKPLELQKKDIVVTKPIEVEKKEVVEVSSEVTKTVFSGCKMEVFSNGFNVVTANPIQTLFIQKTSNPLIYIAHKYNVTGVFIKTESKGVFEFYYEGKFMVEEYLF